MGCGSSTEENPEKGTASGNTNTDEKETPMERKRREERERKALEAAAKKQKEAPAASYSSSSILCIAFDRTEKFVVMGLDNGTLMCRSTSTGEEGGSVLWEAKQAHKGAITSVCCTHKLEGKPRCVTGGRDGKATIWDIQSGREMFSLTGHVMPVNCVEMTRDDSKIFTGGSDKHIIMWDHRTKRETSKLEGHTSLVWCLATSYCGKYLFSGAEDRVICQWALHEGNTGAQMRKKWVAHSGPVFALLPTRDGEHVLSASRDRSIKEWNILTQKETGSFSNGAESITSLALSKDGGKLFVAGNGLSVMDLAVSRGDRVGSDDGMIRGIITSIAMSTDNLHLGVGLSTGAYLTVDASDFVRPEKLAFHKGTVAALHVSESGALVAAASEDTSVTVWNFYSGRLLHRFEGHSSRVWGVCISDAETEVYTASEDSTVRVWNLHLGKCVSVIRGHLGCVWSVKELSHYKLLSCGDDNTLRIWNCDEKWAVSKQQEMSHSSPVVCIAHNKGIVASGSFDNTVKCWSTDTCQELATLEGHTAVVWAVAFTQSNSIVTGSEDQSIKVWTITGNLMGSVDLDHAVGSLFFNTAFKMIVVGCSNGDMIMMPLSLPFPKKISAEEGNGLSGPENRKRLEDEFGIKIKEKAHEDSICALAMHKDCVISGSVDMSIKYWDSTTPPPPVFRITAEM